jgi:hypothetical protein
MVSNCGKSLVLALALLPLSAFGQEKQAPIAGAPGCGDDTVKFEVKTAAEPNDTAPGPGRALVYFIEDDSNFESFPKPTTRAGVDGVWVGATHGNSYLAFSVDPGVHHLCASWQFGVILGKGHQTSAAHFTAEAGGVYYFKVTNTFIHGENSAITRISLSPLDSDEGQLLASKYRQSESQAKLVYKKTE